MEQTFSLSLVLRSKTHLLACGIVLNVINFFSSKQSDRFVHSAPPIPTTLAASESGPLERSEDVRRLYDGSSRRFGRTNAFC